MNRILKLALSWAFLMLLIAAPGMAATYTYGDLYTEWPGYETPLNWKDAHGNPELIGVEVTTRDDDGSLETIKIVFDGIHGVGLFNAPASNFPADFNSLFINCDWNGVEPYGNWDYYVFGSVEQEGVWDSQNVYHPELGRYHTDVYDLTNVDEKYTLAEDAGYRIGHPNGIDTENLSPVSGYLTSFLVENDAITYGFANSKIILGDNFVIGYTPYCANDVFLTPVPEPTTFALFGVGLALALCAHRRRKSVH